MKFLSDKALERLRGSGIPDLSGTRYELRELIARGGQSQDGVLNQSSAAWERFTRQKMKN